MSRRGKGFSDDASAYSYEREYGDVAAVLDAVGPPRLVFGHSSGAICALGAALLTTVDALVLVEPPLPLDGPVMAAEPLAALQAALARGEVEAALQIGRAHGIKMTPAQIEARRARPGWPEELRRGAAWLREFPEINRLPPDAERYRAIAAPCTARLRNGDAGAPQKGRRGAGRGPAAGRGGDVRGLRARRAQRGRLRGCRGDPRLSRQVVRSHETATLSSSSLTRVFPVAYARPLP
jgi:hypothetical protein